MHYASGLGPAAPQGDALCSRPVLKARIIRSANKVWVSTKVLRRIFKPQMEVWRKLLHNSQYSSDTIFISFPVVLQFLEKPGLLMREVFETVIFGILQDSLGGRSARRKALPWVRRLFAGLSW
jgi:hypothetical protein